jgi:hypothetical protein
MNFLRFNVLLIFFFTQPSNLSAQTAADTGTEKTLPIPPGARATTEKDAYDPFLNCTELKNLPKHSTTAEAFSNLASTGGTNEQAFIVGHGAPGEVCTGEGRFCNTTATSFNLYDVEDWNNYAKSILHKFSGLTLLGCDVGQFDEGAAFLAKLADITQTHVRAPTGPIWCSDGRVELDPTAEWLEANPGHRPPTVTGPIYKVPEELVYDLSIDGKMEEFLPDSVSVRRFRYVALPPASTYDSNKDQKPALARLIDFSHPFHHSGIPLAAVTGEITLSVHPRGHASVEKHFLLYADAMVRDADVEGLFYYVDSSLRPQLQQLRLPFELRSH